MIKSITKFNSIKSFQTDLFTAEKIQENDANQFRSNENFEWHLKHWEENNFGLWNIYHNDTHKFIGHGGLCSVETEGKPNVEIICELNEIEDKNDIEYAIINACAELAFEDVWLGSIIYCAKASDKLLQKWLENNGFQYERNTVRSDLSYCLFRMINPLKVEFIPYDENWPKHYIEESKKIRDVLGEHVYATHHIGSTATPNMPGKPIIDIMLECDNVDDIHSIAEKLYTLQYCTLRRHTNRYRSFFTRKNCGSFHYHLHIREKGDPNTQCLLNIRDYLAHDMEYAENYAKLKKELSGKFSTDINGYVSGKAKCMKEIKTNAKLWSARKNFSQQNRGTSASQWTKDKLIKAIEANHNIRLTYYPEYIYPIQLKRVLGYTIPGYTLVNSGLNNRSFNYILDTDIKVNLADVKIAELLQDCSKLNVPMSWWVSPNNNPPDLSTRLKNRGLNLIDDYYGMYFDLDSYEYPTKSDDLSFKLINDVKGFQDYADVLSIEAADQYYSWISRIVTENDPIKYYVGYRNGKAVACGEIVYYAQVAGIYNISAVLYEHKATLEIAMRDFLLQQAKEIGFHVAVMLIPSANLMQHQQLGFNQCCVFHEYNI